MSAVPVDEKLLPEWQQKMLQDYYAGRPVSWPGQNNPAQPPADNTPPTNQDPRTLPMALPLNGGSGGGGGATPNTRPNAPAGYRWTLNGNLEPIPGGPADKSNKQQPQPPEQPKQNQSVSLAERKQNLAEQKFAFEQDKYNQRSKEAQARQQEAQENNGKGPNAPRAPKQPAPKAPKAAQPPKGGGGKGGGGGGGKMMPRVRSTGKFDQSNSGIGDRSFMDTNTPGKWNKKGHLGQSGLKSPGSQWGPETNANTNKKGAANGKPQTWADKAAKNAANVAANKRAANAAAAAAEASRPKPTYAVPDGKGGYTDENGKPVDKWGKPIDPENGNNQPKMTHAYGNKNAKMVRARGDLA